MKINNKLIPGKGGNPLSSKLVQGLGGSNVRISFKDINSVGYDEEISKLRRLCLR